MEVFSHISFEADYSDERVGGEPPGGELLDYLEEDLEARDVRILERGATDYSHAFDIATDKHVFIGMVGAVEERQWLIFVESTLSWWKKLLGASDEAEHLKIMRAIGDSLRANPRMRRLTRYRDAEHWNRGEEGVEA